MPDAVSGGAAAQNAGVVTVSGEVEEEKPLLPPEPVRETGNGPTVSYEESLLREFYGEPNEHGLYGVISDDA